MPLSTAEKSYYTSRKNRALGFIKRLTERYEAACELHRKDAAECEEKLKEDTDDERHDKNDRSKIRSA